LTLSAPAGSCNQLYARDPFCASPRQPQQSAPSVDGVEGTAGPRRRLERAAGQAPRTDVPKGSDEEARGIVAEEVGRLPDKYRRLVLLCCLQGKSDAEAAQALGWPEGTLSGRLARAREVLRRPLTRRGLALPATIFFSHLNGLRGAVMKGESRAPALNRATARDRCLRC
jgi:hypothetical protein